MILVTGSIASGKRTFAQGLGYGADQMADALVDQSPVIFNLQDLVRQRLEAGESLEGLADVLSEKGVVICTEIGAGVIPIEKIERSWREETGRLCNELSAKSSATVRMVCGIPTYLKGEPCA